MSKEDLSRKHRQYGTWAFVGFCRNRGIPFEDCYEVVFGKKPKVV